MFQLALTTFVDKQIKNGRRRKEGEGEGEGREEERVGKWGEEMEREKQER